MSYVKQCDKCKKIISETEKSVVIGSADAPAKEQLHLCQSCNEAFKRDFLRVLPSASAANPQPMQTAPMSAGPVVR